MLFIHWLRQVQLRKPRRSPDEEVGLAGRVPSEYIKKHLSLLRAFAMETLVWVGLYFCFTMSVTFSVSL